MEQPHPRRLTRSREHMLGGVAGGLAEYFDIDPTVARLLFALAALLGLPFVVPAYIVLWVVMPRADADTETGASTAAGHDDRARVLAVLLIGLGTLLLVQQLRFMHWFGWPLFHFSWPLLLIVAGIAVLLARRDRVAR